MFKGEFCFRFYENVRDRHVYFMFKGEFCFSSFGTGINMSSNEGMRDILKSIR